LLLGAPGGVNKGRHGSSSLLQGGERDRVVAVPGEGLEVEQRLQVAGQPGVNAGQQIDGTAVVLALMVSSEKGAAYNVRCRDPRMNGEGGTCIRDVTWLVGGRWCRS